MFISDEDYKVVIGDIALRVISQVDITNRENAEAEAIEEISGYLRPRYDCETIFSKEGSERNRQIIMIVCDIALYHMSASGSGRMGADVRKERYERAIKWLEQVQLGKIMPALPLAQDDEGQYGSPLLYGSVGKIKNVW